MSATGGPDPASPPAPAPQSGAPRVGWSTGRVIAAVAAGIIALPLLAGLWLVVSSTFGSGDPHGYALLGGAFLAVVAGILLVCLVPWIFPAALRLRAFGLALLGYLVLVVAVGWVLANG
ncbi:hypothetical protein [Ruania zhangjianzhongii]|uniref:hypothetical protein n=1 Tax=Ruania zhangjianzhongii TaxID=2603206 RepID=UPI0011C7FF0D|nr:hypothetical protein [Ruania zhangjianzhongii]